MKKVMTKFVTVLFVCAILAASFFGTAAVIKLLSWCFNFEFSWKLTLGIWIVWTALLRLF